MALGFTNYNINIVFIYLKNKRYINHINRYVRLILNQKMENYLNNFETELKKSWNMLKQLLKYFVKLNYFTNIL